MRIRAAGGEKRKTEARRPCGERTMGVRRAPRTGRGPGRLPRHPLSTARPTRAEPGGRSGGPTIWRYGGTAVRRGTWRYVTARRSGGGGARRRCDPARGAAGRRCDPVLGAAGRRCDPAPRGAARRESGAFRAVRRRPGHGPEPGVSAGRRGFVGRQGAPALGVGLAGAFQRSREPYAKRAVSRTRSGVRDTARVGCVPVGRRPTQRRATPSARAAAATAAVTAGATRSSKGDGIT